MSFFGLADKKNLDAELLRTADDPNKPKEPGTFDGFFNAVFSGAMKGYAEISNTIGMAGATAPMAADYFLGGTKYQDWYFENVIDNTTQNAVQYWSFDPLTTGSAGQIAGEVTGMFAQIAAGGGNPIVMSVTKGQNTAQNLVKQGVDPTTANIVGAGQSAALYAGARAPATVGNTLTQKVVSGAAINTAFGLGFDEGTALTLEGRGYNEQAQQFKSTSEARAIDAIMGMGFGGFAYAGRVRDAQSTLKTADSYNNQSSPVIADSAESVSANSNNLGLSIDALARGERIPLEKFQPVSGTPRPINYQTPVQPALFSHKTNTLFQAQVNHNILKTGAASDIYNAAKNTKVKGEEALLIASIETGGKFNADAKNPDSTAHGLFQVTDKTWGYLGGKDRNSKSEQIRIGLKNIEQTKDGLTKSLGREPKMHELYMGHMLGANGAKHVLTASRDTPLIDVVKKFGGKKSNKIVNDNGMKGLTVGQAISKWENKTNEHLSKIRNAKGVDGIGRAVEAGHVPFGYTNINMSKYGSMSFVWGGKGKNNGIDCSGFVYQVMQDNGHKVPYMTTHQMYNNPGKHYDVIDTHSVKSGDVLVWRYRGKNGGEVGHTGIVESFDPVTGKVKYYGSQRSNGKGKKTGPAYAEFNINNSDKVKFLRPKGADTNIQASKNLPTKGMIANADAPELHITRNQDIQPVDAWSGVEPSTYANAHRFGYSNDFLSVAIQETTGIDLDGKPFTVDYNSIGEQIRTAESHTTITQKDVAMIPDIVYQPDAAYHVRLDDGSEGLQFFKTVDNERYLVTAKVDDVQMQVKSVQRESLDAPRQSVSSQNTVKHVNHKTPIADGSNQSSAMTESGIQQTNRVNVVNKQGDSATIPEGNATPETVNAKNISENSGSQQGANSAPDSSVMLHDLLNEHPELRDIEIEAGTYRDGNPIKKKLSEVIEEIESEKNKQIKDAELFEKAAMCAFS